MDCMPTSRLRIVLSFGLLLLLRQVDSAAEEPSFELQVRPILKAYCLECHGGGENSTLR